MTDLKTRIQDDIKGAMKSRDNFTRDTLRLLLGDLQTAEKSGKTPKEFSDAEVEAFIAKVAKSRRASAEIYAEAGDQDRAAAFTAESDLLSVYLPEQMSEEKVVELVRAAIAEQDSPNMGSVMKAVKPTIGTSFDGRQLSQIVKSELAS